MIAKNLKEIRDKIDKIKNNLGIDYDINLMAVSKTFPKEDVIEAIGAGQFLFGENRILEAYSKFKDIPNEKNSFELHIIGHIQRNKAKEAVLIASAIESIDKIETLDAVEKEASKIGKNIDFLIELNSSFEPQKFGINPEDTLKFIDEVLSKNYKYCSLRGLMTVGPLTDDKTKIRESFRLLKKIFDNVRNYLKNPNFNVLSMGMSGD